MVVSIIIQILLILLVLFFVVFTGYEILESQKKYRSNSDRSLNEGDSSKKSPADKTQDGAEAENPFVSILLPVCNEIHVVHQLLKAVSGIKYTQKRYEILVLDDSTGDKAELVKLLVDHINGDVSIDAESGDISKDTDGAHAPESSVKIQYYHRETHEGFKAGNIAFGLSKAKGDFIVIFDADSMPSPDFLNKTMPYFQDSKIGFLQTAIRFKNAGRNFVTRFLNMEISHKDDMTDSQNTCQDFASLTGSSCVWRRACLEDIGGISDKTLTEDVDLCYRAQLKGWHYAYVKDVVSVEELPDTISAMRTQRHRWAYGMVKNSFMYTMGMLANKEFSVAKKFNAFLLMSQSFLLASFYALLILCLPLALVTEHTGWVFNITCLIFLLTTIIWGYNNICGINLSAVCGNDELIGNSQNSKDSGNTKEEKTDAVPAQENCGEKCFLEYIGYVLMYLPLSLYYFVASLEVIAGIRSSFIPTPKGGETMPKIRINSVLACLEKISLLYAIVVMITSICYSNYWILFYSVICTSGFMLTLWLSMAERQEKYFKELKHVVITGATGEIGGALARKYAAPGRHLTLSGRKEERLLEVKAECEKLGSTVSIKVLDLRNTDELRAWAGSLGDELPVDLLIANAGLNTNIGEDLRGEPFEEARALVEVNLLSDIALIDAALPAMRRRGRGQIAIFSSLASYYGLVYTPTYCATKAALRNYGNSLRAWLKPEGIKINVILPGYIDSPMCRAMPGPKPFLMHADRAVNIISRGLSLNLARISFPFPLNLGIWSLSFLPHCLAAPIAALFGYGIMKPHNTGESKSSDSAGNEENSENKN